MNAGTMVDCGIRHNILNKYPVNTVSVLINLPAMKHLLVLFLVVSVLTTSTMPSISGVCPPCPGPPVHACCQAGEQVLGTCCQAQEKCCFPVDDDLPPYCTIKDTCDY